MIPAAAVTRKAGASSGPLVVLLHGSMDRGAAMARVVAELDGLDVIRYDRRGYGRSEKAGACSLDGHVDDLVAVAEGRTVVAVGHSFGGLVALAAAQSRPETVMAVGAFEAPMPWCDWWPTGTAGTVAMGAGEPGDAAEAFLRRMIGTHRYDALPEATKAQRRREGPALVAELRSARAPGAPYDPATLTVPVVAGRGTTGPAHLRRAADVLADTVPGAELVVIEGADHGAHLSHPVEFAAFVRRAVARAGEQRA